MELPAGHTWRRATPADVADVCALVIAVDVEEYGEPDYEESDVRQEWSHPRLDLASDSWLVHSEDGRLVGYALTWEKDPGSLLVADTFVHPDSPDLYPWLVERVGERAAGAGTPTVHAFCSEPNKRRAAALTDAGYAVCRVFRRMVLDLAAPIADPAPGPGVAIRRVTPEDVHTVWAINHESFVDHFDNVPEPYDAWYARVVEAETYRPDLWWLAEADGVPAGALIGMMHDENGWIRSLATLPAARGRGVGTALLLTAFAALRSNGAPRVGLGVDSDNTTGAMALYERSGMRAEQRYDCYELRRLRPRKP